MPIVAPFCYLYEFRKPVEERVHHNNIACSIARLIPSWQKKPGTGDYPLCKECEKCNVEGR